MNQTGLDFSDYIIERTRNFTGRGWVFSEIEKWLSDPKGSRFFILSGEPGIGKSAIAAQLSRFSDGAVKPPIDCQHLAEYFLSAYHFCFARYGGWISPEIFTRSLSAQLSQRFPDFSLALVTNPKFKVELTVQNNQGTAVGVQINNYYAESPQALFDDLVRLPLKSFCDQRDIVDPIVILVDGLDEALSYEGRTTIPRLLATCGDLPQEIRFILTTRLKDQVLDLFKPLKPFILLANKEDNQNDVRDFIKQRCEDSPEILNHIHNDSLSKEIISQLAQTSKGNFLVISKVLDSAERHEINLSYPNQLPSDLTDLYTWNLERIVRGDKNTWQNLYCPILGILSAARDAITIETVHACTGLTLQSIIFARQDLKDLLDPEMEGKFRLYHESVADFLTKDSTSQFYINVVNSHRQIANNYLKLIKLKPGNWEAIDHYGVQYLAYHLAQSGDWEGLFDLLTDFDYLETRCQMTSVYDLQGDYQLALKVWCGSKDQFRILGRFEERLRLEAGHVHLAVLAT